MNIKSIILYLGRRQIGKGCNFKILEDANWILLNPIYNNLEGFGLWISCPMASWRAFFVSVCIIRFRIFTVYPCSSNAAATQANPNGKTGILICYVLADIRRTLMISGSWKKFQFVTF
jgi:hypothetical protein